MVELDGDHGDGDDHKMNKWPHLEKRKRKQKWAQGKGIIDRTIFVSPIKTP